jgi:PBP1b-binding outer membrane lipoprotein LpoB
MKMFSMCVMAVTAALIIQGCSTTNGGMKGVSKEEDIKNESINKDSSEMVSTNKSSFKMPVLIWIPMFF